MPERFRPSEPDANFSVRREDLSPHVLEYVDNLESQLDALLSPYGVGTFRDVVRMPNDERPARVELALSAPDFDRYDDLFRRFRTAIRTNSIPRDDREASARRAFEKRSESIMREAIEAMGGENVLGPADVEEAYGVRLDERDVPPVPFSRVELECARELGQVLLLRIDRMAGGKPLSMKAMEDRFQPKFVEEGKGNVFRHFTERYMFHYETEPFFVSETPRTGWALVSKEVVPGTEGNTYVEQTKAIIDLLRTRTFGGQPIPDDLQKAIEKFEPQIPAFEKLWKSDSVAAHRTMESLDITRLTRQTPVEVAYDSLLLFERTSKKILQDTWAWTSRCSSNGQLVHLGKFHGHGLCVYRVGVGHSSGGLGAILSRR